MIDPKWFGNNEYAVQLFEQFSSISHVWDDVEDGEIVSKQTLNQAFKLMLFDIPSNPLFLEICPDIMPLVKIGIAGWESANIMEKSKDEHLIEIAHGLRYSIAHVFAYLSIKIIGYNEFLKIAPEFWRETMPERFEEYKKEHIA